MVSVQQHPQFEEALSAVDSGDESTLRELLENYPDLVHARSTNDDRDYSGYFWRATLLQHIAGNPYRHELPDNIVNIARMLIEAGSDVTALCGGGKKQPDTVSSAIGLVASSSHAYDKGLAGPLITLLLQAGAGFDSEGAGALLWTALYHTVENQGQREVARLLYDRGHPIDMCYAAGLGLIHEVREYIYLDGSLKEGADMWYKHQRKGAQPASDGEILEDAFIFACACGEVKMAEFLLSQGVNVDVQRPWGNEKVTGLHLSAWAGWVEITKLMLKHGADTTIRDINHGSTALGWADYCRNKEVFNLLFKEENLDIMDALEFGKTERFIALFGEIDPNRAFGKGKPGVLLRIAAYQGNKDLAQFLLDKGADPNLASNDGTTALGWAEKQQNTEVIRMLKERGANAQLDLKQQEKAG